MFRATVPIIRRSNCVNVTLGTCYSLHVSGDYVPIIRRNKHTKKKLCTKLALNVKNIKSVTSLTNNASLCYVTVDTVCTTIKKDTQRFNLLLTVYSAFLMDLRIDSDYCSIKR